MSPAGRYYPLTPYRVLDTRNGTGAPKAPIGPNFSIDLQVSGTGSGTNKVPADATAVVLNVTEADATSGSYLTVWPQGQARPLASNLNFSSGQTVPNRVIVPVGTSGRVSIYNQQGSTNVIADAAGW